MGLSEALSSSFTLRTRDRASQEGFQGGREHTTEEDISGCTLCMYASRRPITTERAQEETNLEPSESESPDGRDGNEQRGGMEELLSRRGASQRSPGVIVWRHI